MGVLFALCFLPCFVARVLLAASREGARLRAPERRCAADVTTTAPHLPAGRAEPVVYCFSSPAFRHSYRKLFYSLTLRARRRTQRPRAGTSGAQTPEDRHALPVSGRLPRAETGWEVRIRLYTLPCGHRDSLQPMEPHGAATQN